MAIAVTGLLRLSASSVGIRPVVERTNKNRTKSALQHLYSDRTVG